MGRGRLSGLLAVRGVHAGFLLLGLHIGARVVVHSVVRSVDVVLRVRVRAVRGLGGGGGLRADLFQELDF